MTSKENEYADKVFVGRSMNDFLETYGSIKEYYESFSSQYSNMLLEQWYVVEVFICGLPWEIGNNVRSFKPNNLFAAYLLAVLEEISCNLRKQISHQPLLASTKLNESNVEEKESKGLLVVDEDCKETALKVSEMDVGNELVDNIAVETVEESFATDNRLVDNARCDEAKLKVSEMDDNSNSKEEAKESIGSVSCEENVVVKGRGILPINLIVLDELSGGKVKGIEMESRQGVHEKLDKDHASMSFEDCTAIVVQGIEKQRIVGSGLEISEDDERKGYVSLSFKKEMDVDLGRQKAAEFPETFCFSPTGIGAYRDNMIVDEGCIQSNIRLFGNVTFDMWKWPKRKKTLSHKM